MQAGTAFAVTVEARDANNNVAENFTGSVNLNAAAVGGSNFVGGNAERRRRRRRRDASTASSSTTPPTATEVTASAPGVNNGVSNAFNVTATHLAVLADAQRPCRRSVQRRPSQARDANNNVAENFTGNVNLNAAATGGSNFNGGTANVGRRRRHRDLRRPRPEQRRQRLHRHGQPRPA